MWIRVIYLAVIYEYANYCEDQIETWQNVCYIVIWKLRYKSINTFITLLLISKTRCLLKNNRENAPQYEWFCLIMLL